MANPFDDIVQQHTGPVNLGAGTGYRDPKTGKPAVVLMKDNSGQGINPLDQQNPNGPDPAMNLNAVGENSSSGQAAAEIASGIAHHGINAAVGYGQGALPGNIGKFVPPEIADPNSVAYKLAKTGGFLTSPVYGKMANIAGPIAGRIGETVADAGVPIPIPVIKNALLGGGWGAEEGAADQTTNAAQGKGFDPRAVAAQTLYGTAIGGAAGPIVDKVADVIQNNRIPEKLAESPLASGSLAEMKNPQKANKDPAGMMQENDIYGGVTSIKNQAQALKDSVDPDGMREQLFQNAENAGKTIPIQQVLQPFTDKINSLLRVANTGNAAAKEAVDHLSQRALNFWEELGGGQAVNPRDLHAVATSANNQLKAQGQRAVDAAYSGSAVPNTNIPLENEADRAIVSSSAKNLADLANQLDPSFGRAYSSTMKKYGQGADINRLAGSIDAERSNVSTTMQGTAQKVAALLGHGPVSTYAGNILNRATLPESASVSFDPRNLGLNSRQDILRMFNVGAQNGDIDPGEMARLALKKTGTMQ